MLYEVITLLAREFAEVLLDVLDFESALLELGAALGTFLARRQLLGPRGVALGQEDLRVAGDA